MSESTVAQLLKVRVEPAGENLTIALEGRLDAMTLPGAWEQTVLPAKRRAGGAAKTITVDAAKLVYCDGAGLGLFAELRRVAAEAGGEMRFEHLSPALERLVAMSLLDDPMAGALDGPARRRIVARLGKATAETFWDLRQLVAFIGELSAALLWALWHPHRIRYRDLMVIARKAGADGIPVVCLLGLLVGVILSFEMAEPLERYGAQHLIPNIVGFALIRELGPLITAVILAGRSGAAFAAEIGTMKVTEELAALETLGFNPTRFLVIPRVLAAVCVTPLLTAFNVLFGLIGGCVVMLSMHYTFTYYVSTLRHAISARDFIGGMFKALVFGLIVAGVGCMRGTQTRSGPGAVGDSTTRAVVAGIVLTIVADAILGTLYYYLGIKLTMAAAETTSDKGAAKAIIEVKDLRAGYDDNVIVEHLSFSVNAGEIFIIAGGSGSGKSTVLKAMIGLLPPEQGRVLIHGLDVYAATGAAREKILRSFGTAFQSGALFGNMTVLENLRLPMEEFTALSSEQMNMIALAKLKLVNLEQAASKLPSELSGGMQKRAAIARALALDPPIVFLDEPSAGLDPITSADLDQLILDLNGLLGTTFVIVTHELASIFTLADRVLMLDAKRKTAAAIDSPERLRDSSSDPLVKAFFNRAPSHPAAPLPVNKGSA